MRRVYRVSLAGLLGLTISASFALAEPFSAPGLMPSGALPGFDAPQPVLNLAPPDRIFVAGLAPGESLAIPARSATTINSRFQADAAGYAVCAPAAGNGGPASLLQGPVHASTATGGGRSPPAS